ncbi:hypothetical protein L6452_04986 [Arctium lappa]|uniref:Uncharacterized protein n=1 Tax=Arctium lappa TaxID=4217 RepID=A0ACB9EER1_ARCLA|nr:hypothetical protein L6452_04986 [Arctium lappa]
MTKEEGDYIDVDGYVPKAERKTIKRKKRVDLGKEDMGTGSKGDNHAETMIPREGKKVVEEEDMAWEPSEEVPLQFRKSKRRVTQTGSVSKVTRKQKDVEVGSKRKPKAIRFDKLVGLSERAPEDCHYTRLLKNRTEEDLDVILSTLGKEELSTIERVGKEKKVGEVVEMKPVWAKEMESELEKLKKKMVDWESTKVGQEEHFKEVLRAQREDILKEVCDTFGRTTDLSGSSDETTVLKEENARLKRELEALKARLRTKFIASKKKLTTIPSDLPLSLSLTHTQVIEAIMAPASVGVAVRTSLTVLACVMAASIAYLLAVDGVYACFRPSDWWGWKHVILVDFCINIAIIGAWFAYKESSWIMRAAFLFLLFWFGSVATCGYIVLQFYKLSPEESSKDPLYFVLARREKGDVVTHIRGPSVVNARIIFVLLDCLMLGISIYALIVDGSPFQSKVFTPCMVVALIDIYIHVVVLSVWMAYKESSWISAFFWIVLLVCFRSITTCVYLVWQLFYLSPQQSISEIIFSRSNRDSQSSDPLLMAHPDV